MAPKDKKSTTADSGLTEAQKVDLQALLEDVYLNHKWRIIRMNFLRGVAFGLGTFLGGTILVALLVWLLYQTVDLFPPVRDFVQRLIDSLGR